MASITVIFCVVFAVLCFTTDHVSGTVTAVRSREEIFDHLKAHSKTPVVLFISAPWCGSCKLVYHEVEDFAREYFGRVVVLKMDGDELQEVSDELHVYAFPTFKIFSHAKIANTVVGGDMAQVKYLVDELLTNNA